MLFPLSTGDPQSELSGQIPVGGRYTINSPGISSQTTTGWALVDNVVGNISGYALFEYGGQMATVPIESEFSSRFILSFENGPGWHMGVALVNPCINNSTVSVTFRDSNGSAVIADSFVMSPSQHMSFLLSQRYPALVGRWGTALFETGGCAIAGLGILANSAGAYTTVFALDAP